jgi:transglutaminase-like putative cysteine protease
MFGIPARVVVGLMLVGADGRVAAFGHAWVEVYGQDIQALRVLGAD